MEKDSNLNLDELLQHSASIKMCGKVNFYSVKYFVRNQKDNFAICLPGNMNEQFLRDICEHLEALSSRRCVPFHPVSYEAETYEYLAVDEIQSHWDGILELIGNAEGFKDDENKRKVSKANLSICLLEYKNVSYYLCSRQQTLKGLLKGKRVLMSGNDKLEPVDAEKLFLLNGCIDFVICAAGSPKKPWAFIFERRNFFSVFNYYEHLKRSVQEKLPEIDRWDFLASTELIKNKSEQKNVYLNLSKVFSDQDYLRQMKQVSPADLKSRLVNKSGGAFTENDFEGEKLLVTTQNLDRVMRMLAKGFKYNFFADRAEEV